LSSCDQVTYPSPYFTDAARRISSRRVMAENENAAAGKKKRTSPKRLDGRLGEAVRRAREAKGMSLARLSAISGISRRHLGELESGANVSIDKVLRVAVALDLDTLPIGGPVTVAIRRPARRLLNRVAFNRQLAAIEARVKQCRRLLADAD
jgi:transcriptional regulator with XRE-family HTH domain